MPELGKQERANPAEDTSRASLPSPAPSPQTPAAQLQFPWEMPFQCRPDPGKQRCRGPGSLQVNHRKRFPFSLTPALPTAPKGRVVIVTIIS